MGVDLSSFETVVARLLVKYGAADKEEHVSEVIDNKESDSVNTLGPFAVLQRLGVSYSLVTDTAEAATVIAELSQAKVIGIDIETCPLPGHSNDPKAGLDPHKSRIRTIQCCADSHSYVFDMDAIPLDVFASLWSVPLVAHNATFEAKFFLNAGVLPVRIGCTMLMDLILRGGGAPKSLSALCKDILGFEPSKEIRLSDWSLSELNPDQIAYAAMDAAIAFRLFQEMNARISKRGLSGITRIVSGAIPAIASMELNGIPIDRGMHRSLVEGWVSERDSLEAKLKSTMGLDDLSQKKQVALWFGAYCGSKGLDIPKGKNGLVSIGKDGLAPFADDPLISDWLAYNNLCTRINTFGESLIAKVNLVTQRIHPRFVACRARTGRFGSQDPNVQNFPRGAFRELIRPAEGHVFVVADYSQIELRLVAIVADETAMLEAYKKGEDLHIKTASQILRISTADVTKEQRTLAKATNFGLIYGQSPGGLKFAAKASYGVDITFDEAKAYRAAFFRSYPAISRLHTKIASELRSTGYARTIHGWTRRIKEEAQRMVAKKEERLGSFVQSLDRAIASKAEAVRILQGHQDRKQTESTQDKIAKKQGVIDRYNKRIALLSTKVKDTERKITLAKQCRDFTEIPYILCEKGERPKKMLFEAYNVPIQGLGASIMLRALSLIFDAVKHTQIKLINSVHDELVIECESSEAARVKETLTECMIKAFTDTFPEHSYMCSDLVEAKVGLSWGEAK